MNTKTEILMTDLPALAMIHCESCVNETLHKIIASHLTKIEYESDDLESAKQIVRCEVCEEVSYRTLWATRDDHEENSKGEWVYIVNEIRYLNSMGKRKRFTADESNGVFE